MIPEIRLPQRRQTSALRCGSAKGYIPKERRIADFAKGTFGAELTSVQIAANVSNPPKVPNAAVEPDV